MCGYTNRRICRFPPYCERQPNPAYHLKTLQMHEVAILVSSLPFILKNMVVTEKTFRPSAISRFKATYDIVSDDPTMRKSYDGKSIMKVIIEVIAS